MLFFTIAIPFKHLLTSLKNKQWYFVTKIVLTYTGDWPPCDRPVLTEPARVPLLARCRTGAAAAGHLHSHALLPWDALVLPRRLDML